jgi:site-specific DNA-methyltransferase (adenine-specific)
MGDAATVLERALVGGPTEGSVDAVLRGEAAWCVVHGDALHVLRDLPCINAFVADPPYSSGGAFRGDRVKDTTAKYVSTGSANREIPAFDGDVRDQRSFTLWTALWSSEAWRCAVDGCHLVSFSDWRQLPSLCDAERRISRDGCFRVIADRDKLHQAVKPLSLMERLVTIAPVGGVVVDPFAGSGSTCAAAVRQGRRVIGIEINREWAEVARERVRADISGSDYAARAAGQRALFDSR